MTKRFSSSHTSDRTSPYHSIFNTKPTPDIGLITCHIYVFARLGGRSSQCLAKRSVGVKILRLNIGKRNGQAYNSLPIEAENEYVAQRNFPNFRIWQSRLCRSKGMSNTLPTKKPAVINTKMLKQRMDSVTKRYTIHSLFALRTISPRK